MPKNTPRLCLLTVTFLFILASLAWTTGCALPSADENASDIPWNTPASWEGTPAIPGLNSQGM